MAPRTGSGSAGLATLLVMLLVLGGLVVLFEVGEEVAGALPLVDISFNEDSYSAEVDMENGDVVNGTGEVFVWLIGYGSNVQSVRVDLIIFVDGKGWNCEIIPQTFVFNETGGVDYFNFTVEVPPGAITGSYYIVITGTATTIPGVGYGIQDSRADLEVDGVGEGSLDIGEPLTTTGDIDFGSLRIDGDTVAWLDCREVDFWLQNDLLVADLGNREIVHLTNDTRSREDLSLSDGTAVYVLWDDSSNITLHDIAEGTVSSIDAGLQPSNQNIQIHQLHMSGETVAFIATEPNDLQDSVSMDFDAYVYDLDIANTTRYSDTSAVSRNEDFNAVTDGLYMLYLTEQPSEYYELLNIVDLENGAQSSVRIDENYGGPADMDDGNAVFIDFNNEPYNVVYFSVETQEYTTIVTQGNAASPRIDNGRIIFENYNESSTSWDIYLYDIATTTLTSVCRLTSRELSPDISGDTVVCLSDRDGGYNIYTYDLNELNLNAPPTITAMTAQPSTVQPDSVSTIQVTASDPDDDTLTFSYNATGGTIEGTGQVVTWQAPSEEGDYTITCIASDGLMSSDPAQVVVTVDAEAPVEHIPVIDTVTAVPQEVEPGGDVVVTVTAHDDDGDDLEYVYETTAGEFESGGELTSDDSDIWVAPDTEGTYTLGVRAFDGTYYSAPGEVDVVVTDDPAPPPDNDPPSIDDIDVDPSPAIAGQISTITVTASDPDGDELTYSYSAEAGSIRENDEEAEWTPPMADGKYRITVVVTDPSGASDTDSVRVTVIVENVAPVISQARANVSSVPADDETGVLLTVQVSDGNGLGDISDVRVDLGDLELSDSQKMYDDGRYGDEEPGDGVYTFELAVQQGVPAGEYDLEVTVEDLAGEKDIDTITLEVTEPPEEKKDGGDGSSTPGFGAPLMVAVLLILTAFSAAWGRRRR